MKTIVAATDFSDEARYAAGRAAILAEEQRAAERKIWELIRDSHVDSDRVSSVVERGDPSPVILAKAEELLSDLIVMGKQGQSWIEDLFLGAPPIMSSPVRNATCLSSKNGSSRLRKNSTDTQNMTDSILTPE